MLNCKKHFILLILPILLSCNTLFNIIAGTPNDETIYYNVATNEIVNTNIDNGIMSFWFTKKQKGKSEILDHIKLDEPLNKFELPIIRDSIDFYDFTISVNLLKEHWREQHHIVITKKLIQKKKFILSRYTGH